MRASNAASKYDIHAIKRPKRSIIAVILMVIYVLIPLSPLASLAMHSKSVALAVPGECSGDCDICGCSAESRAARTCCCSKKKQQQADIHTDQHHGKQECEKKAPTKKKAAIAACGCPCGSGKQVALSISGTSEVLPYHFTEQFSIPHSDTIFIKPIQRLTSRHGEPPDPPPELSLRS